MTRLLPKWTPLVLALAICACSDTPTHEQDPPDPPEPEVVDSTSRIVVDAGVTLGPVMQIARASTHSTSSPLPGEATRAYMQGLQHEVVRTWIQTRYVYNKGNIDYNYKYEGSRVGAEDALRFYATTGRTVLIALSAYNATSAWPLPQGDAFKDFLRETLVYYKRKYPNIRYIQVGNEPDAADETMATYYPIYRHYYRAVNEANAALNLQGDDRILISNGPFTSNVPNMLEYAGAFLTAYAADTDPAKKLDFFSFHSYGETNRPLELLTARQRIDAAMAAHGLPRIPVFVSEYGMFGGSTLPTRMTPEEVLTMQPAGQLTKAFYLYEGGIDNVFNWAIHHATLPSKSQVANVETGVLYPYGHALRMAKAVSDRQTRVQAMSRGIDTVGLGTHVLASMLPGRGVAVLVWNFNWRNPAPEPALNVFVNHLSQTIVGARVRRTIYLLDSQHNNVFTNPAQTTLQPLSEEVVPFSTHMNISLSLETSAVALILLEPESNATHGLN